MGGAMGALGNAFKATTPMLDAAGNPMLDATGKAMTTSAFTPGSILSGLGKTAGSLQKGQQGQQQQQQPMQPVNFNIPAQPFIPSPLAQQGPNPFYGG